MNNDIECIFEELELNNVKLDTLIKLIGINKIEEVEELISEFLEEDEVKIVIEELEKHIKKEKTITPYSIEELKTDLELSENKYLLVLANIFGNIEKVFIFKNNEDILVLFKNEVLTIDILKQIWKID
jgi:hypothetical protein